MGDEEGRIGLSFLQSQALSPGLYSALKSKAGELTKGQSAALLLVQILGSDWLNLTMLAPRFMP